MPPYGGRPMGWPALSVMPTFQSTPPRGGDVSAGMLDLLVNQFQFTPPLTGATLEAFRDVRVLH